MISACNFEGVFGKIFVSLVGKIFYSGLIISLLSLWACAPGGSYQNTLGGAVSGAAIGAGSGAIIGGTRGRAGPGVAIGAGIGAITGALAGAMVDRQVDQNNALQSQIASNQAQIEENRRLIEELRSKGADVRSTDRGVVINLPDILFEFDRYVLTKPAMLTIGEISDVLEQVPHRSLSVEGHTDSIGSVLYNKQLSQRRADAVASELKRQGVRANIKTRGLGEGYPVATNNSDAGRARNRRVEIIVEN
ncbi:MAG TPA: OmpA family protein [Oligoflexia bacterium]|nr:OmpA family protein [Oligoflexia bacterium]HMP48261.1 OmpA family protein [Oligoflexia bacterium]